MKTNRNDLTAGGLGGILTDIETVEEIAAMPNNPTNYPTSELVKLKALARAATPEPWVNDADGCIAVHYPQGGKATIATCPIGFISGVNGIKNAAFIAAANPATILSLVEHIESQAARIAELEGALKPFSVMAGPLFMANYHDNDLLYDPNLYYAGKVKPSLRFRDFRKARQAYTGDITTHESTAPYAHPYADAVKGISNG